MDCTVTFLPSNKSVSVPQGTLISEAAAICGITSLHLPCGGRGICGKCTVQIASSDAAENRRSVTACTTRVEGPLTVWIDEKSRAAASCIVAESSEDKRLQDRSELLPLCSKVSVQTRHPGLEDNYSDLELLQAALKTRTGNTSTLRCSRALLQTLAKTLRAQKGRVTATLFTDECIPEIVSLEEGDTLSSHYGIACDLGTTTVSLRLVNCSEGIPVSVESDYNGQISRGSDVISRIEYGRSAERREELRQLALTTINRLIEKVCVRSAVNSQSITAVSMAGNSTMTHLLLGLDARHLRESPYVPSVKHLPPLTAAECGLAVDPDAKVFFSPGVGSYVGGDITAGLLCTDLIRSSGRIFLYIDIGTNGEIVIGNSEFLLTTACSCGPAFEGSGISCGMRAAVGAVDSFEIGHKGASTDWTVIGESPPAGVCGSGLISLLGELLNAGLIDRSGSFTDACPPERMTKGTGPRGYILFKGSATAHGRDIIITESDIDNLVRTKAAIYSAGDCLLSKAGLDYSKLDKVYIAGGFGRFIDLRDAVRTGLFPDLPPSKFSYLGNTSLTGATLALLSKKYRDELNALPSRMTYVELANDQRYMDAYTAALFLPHTDLHRFGRNPEFTG